MKHFLVIGRLPYDDEDSAYKYTGQLTLGEVIQLFRDEISEDRGVEVDPEDPDTIPFVVSVFSSDSPIKHEADYT